FSSRRRHTRFSRDWSSDVCSSDLARGDVGPTLLLGHSEGGLIALEAAARRPDLAGLVLLATPGRPAADVLRGQLEALDQPLRAEIGRASCRERWRARWGAEGSQRQ